MFFQAWCGVQRAFGVQRCVWVCESEWVLLCEPGPGACERLHLGLQPGDRSGARRGDNRL